MRGLLRTEILPHRTEVPFLPAALIALSLALWNIAVSQRKPRSTPDALKDNFHSRIRVALGELTGAPRLHDP